MIKINRKIFYAIFSLVLALLLLSGCGSSDNVLPEDELVWDSFNNDFVSMKYPAQWDENKVNEQSDFAASLVSGNIAETTDALADESVSEADLDYLPVIYIRNGYSSTMSSFSELKNDIQNEANNYEEVFLSNLKEITIDGQKSLEFVLMGPVDLLGNENLDFPVTIKAKFIMIPNYTTNEISLIVYYTTMGKYPNAIEIFDEMISSIKLDKN